MRALLAKAERDARALGYTFEWDEDWACGSHVKEYGASIYLEGEPETCEGCSIISPEGKGAGSLGCIDNATREYRRVVEAELAMEALAARTNMEVTA